MAEYLESEYAVSQRRACRTIGLARSSRRRANARSSDTALVNRCHELSDQYPRFGYRKIHARLQGEGWRIGRERLRLIRRREGLRVSRPARPLRPKGSGAMPVQAEYPGHVWSYDFVHDETTNGRRMRVLSVVEEFTRQGLAAEPARSLTSRDVMAVLEGLIAMHGAPDYLRSDNGSEFTADAVKDWLDQQGIKTHFIDPGSPWQNGKNESFNAVLRDGCLNRWLFDSIHEARLILDAWLHEYNHERPHGALNQMTPAAYAAWYANHATAEVA